MLELDIKKLLLAQARACLETKELSKKSYIPKATLTSILNGKRNAKPKTIGMLAKALDIDVTEILINEENEK
ncbi:helix-turn-helix transcriptional regulator [Clostridium botulinum]|nr:helix-turn-helix transcriptional regulator [Clostridium botulinum]